jgi:uncharacterized iron-regulated membrane protein
MATKSYKKTIRKAHLILGLASGLIVFIVAITGCCWVFQQEITEWLEGDRSVAAQALPFINPEEAKNIAQAVFPNKEVHGTLYGHATDPLEVIFYEAEPEFYQSIFLNPYTGKILDVKNHRSGFFWFVLRGHLYLWLPPQIGTEIMSYGTMIFVVLLITGIILWLPKKRKYLDQRLSFKWKSSTRWRRKNFDLHSILGFYTSFLALIIAFSGLIMAFNWVYYVTYKVWGGTEAPQFIIPNNDSDVLTFTDAKEAPINRLFDKLVKEHPDYKSFEFHYPHSDSSSIYVEIATQEGVFYNSDYRFFDQYTLAEIDPKSIYSTYKTASLADKVIRMNYDIHVGAIGGIPGKILAFFISLLIATLPITGALLWWGRLKKENQAAK